MRQFMFGSENFPILFENADMVVYRNQSAEIFVKSKHSGENETPVSLRIGGISGNRLNISWYNCEAIIMNTSPQSAQIVRR